MCRLQTAEAVILITGKLTDDLILPDSNRLSDATEFVRLILMSLNFPRPFKRREISDLLLNLRVKKLTRKPPS